jgi:hypothetical protein
MVIRRTGCLSRLNTKASKLNLAVLESAISPTMSSTPK